MKTIVKGIRDWRVIGVLLIVLIAVTVWSKAGSTSSLYINGKAVDAKLGQPVYRAGVLYLPVEPIVTGMGDRFIWQTKPKTAVIKQQDGTQLMLSAASSLIRVNGQDIPISTTTINTVKVPVAAKPAIISGTLYYPIDFYQNILKYPVEIKKSGDKEYVFVGTVPNELPQEPTPAPTANPTPTTKPTTPNEDGMVYGKLDMPQYKTPDGWLPPLIQSVATNDALSNSKILEKELGLTRGVLYNPYGKDASEGLAKVIIGGGGDNYLADVTFLAWYGSKTSVHVSNSIPYIARELFKFYLPNDYTTLFDIIVKGVNGGDVTKYTKAPFNLGGRAIKIIDGDSGFTVMFGKK